MITPEEAMELLEEMSPEEACFRAGMVAHDNIVQLSLDKCSHNKLPVRQLKDVSTQTAFGQTDEWVTNQVKLLLTQLGDGLEKDTGNNETS